MLEQLAKHFESKLKTFDPRDEQDVVSYYNLKYLGRQSDRRYILEQPFPDVVAMMHHKIAEMVLKEHFGEKGLNYKY